MIDTNQQGCYKEEDIENFILVTKKYPKAYVKRIVEKTTRQSWNVYQIRVKTSWFTYKILSDTHLYQYQAWEDAAKKLNND